MNSYQGFDDLPPILYDGLPYNPDPDDDLWLMENGLTAPCISQSSFSWNGEPSQAVYGLEQLYTGNQGPTILDLFARETRDDPYIPSQLQNFFRNTHMAPCYESIPTQPYPFSPIATYRQRQSSPIETVTSSSSRFDEGLSYWRSYPTSDQESIGSPQPLSPREPQSQLYGRSFFQQSGGASWPADDFCALREVQHFADDDADRCARPIQEPDFNLHEMSFKEEHYCEPPRTITNGDEQAVMQPQRDQPLLNPGRSRRGSDEDADPAYKPIQPKARRQLSDSNGTRMQGLTRSRIAKRVSPKASMAHSGNEKQHLLTTLSSITQKSAANNTSRPFSCPLAPYECNITFTSKNEWKRHICSRHLCVGFWRCDLCPESDTRPNDFNRKDLFTQHLRRMHHPSKDEINNGIQHQAASNKKAAANKKAKPERRDSQSEDMSDDPFERELPLIRQRCWVQIRDPPKRAFCAFCENHFTGEKSFDDWLEHTGKHLADLAKRKPSNGQDTTDTTEKWAKDEVFREWLLEQGFIKPGDEEETWVLVEDTIVRDINMQRMERNVRS